MAHLPWSLNPGTLEQANRRQCGEAKLHVEEFEQKTSDDPE